VESIPTEQKKLRYIERLGRGVLDLERRIDG
jgi:hypothetical protein